MMPGDPAPDVGIYTDVREAEYHSWPGASNSRLGIIATRTPAHMLASLMAKDTSTPAKILGTAIHCAILQPDLFESSYVVAKRCDQITGKNEQCKNVGTLWRTDFGWMCGTHSKGLAGDEGRRLITAEDRAICLGVRDSAYRHRSVRSMMERSTSRELSIVWEDRATGVRCKARWDIAVEDPNDGVIADVKSTDDASRIAFQRSIYKFGYHRQSAMYLDGAAAHDIAVRHYVVIPVEKKAPFAVGAYRLDSEAVAAGRAEIQQALAKYVQCLNAGEWPAYSDDIETISLPPYAFSQIEDRLAGDE